jgi:hypothetical protein
MPFHRPIPQAKSQVKPRTSAASALASLVEAEKMMQIAILLPCSAFIGGLGGAWLDSRLHQSWITISGILFGGVAGLVYVVRMVVSAGKKSAGGKGSTETKP